MTLSVSANRPATTTAARTARSAAAVDRAGTQAFSHRPVADGHFDQGIWRARTVAGI
jgi:hypothetical protein